MLSPTQGNIARERVESWKRIASHLGRDERTAKRWERERKLPIHRLPGGRGGVFAYTDELAAWMDSGADSEAISQDQTAQPDQPAQSAQPITPPPARTLRRSDRRSTAVLALAGAALVLVSFYASAHRPRSLPARAASPPAENSEAHDFYLQGRYFWSHRTEASLKRAADAYTQAIVRDPNYAPAYAGLAATYDLMPQFSAMKSSEALPLAIAAAHKAIALDETLPEAHRALGWALFLGPWDLQGALNEYRRAIQLAPNDPETHHWYANELLTLGQIPEAMSEIQRARTLDPSSRAIQMDYASILYWSGQRGKALSQMLAIEHNEPDFLAPPRYLMENYFQQGDFPAYITQSTLAATLSRSDADLAVARAARAGWTSGGRAGLLRAMLVVQRKQFESGEASGFRLAMTYVQLGRFREANVALAQARDHRDPGVLGVFSGLIYDRMRHDPEFQQFESTLQTATGSHFTPVPLPQ